MLFRSSMYDRSDADEWHDDVFVSAIVRLVPKMEKAWAAPGDGVAESESGKLAGGRKGKAALRTPPGPTLARPNERGKITYCASCAAERWAM